MKLLDGKKLANSIRNDLEKTIKLANATPGLAIFQVGNDKASSIYVEKKIEACNEVGIQCHHEHIDESVSMESMIEKITIANKNDNVHGIIIQLPLPQHLHPQKLIETISPNKDVDGFHPYNFGRLANRCPILQPSTPFGIMQLLNHYEIDCEGKHAVIVGASSIVGKPMALALLNAGSTVTICHKLTKDLSHHVSEGDILVVAIGKPGVVKTAWIKPNAVVIDVGITRHDNGEIHGDIDFNTAKDKASFITPVPGGVGPMTVAALLQNTALAMKLQKSG